MKLRSLTFGVSFFAVFPVTGLAANALSQAATIGISATRTDAYAQSYEPVIPLDQPDERYEHRLSSDHPLSRNELLDNYQSQATHVLQYSLSSGGNTYTYLRCFYKKGSDAARPAASAYAWAIDPLGRNYYKIYGYWASHGPDSIGMFYSNISQDTLRQVCNSTLAGKGITPTNLMPFAANNSLSYNHTVWTNDSAVQQAQINKIVAFGDSLSDNQNFFNASQWKFPNHESWYLGHFSNGYAWVEYLASMLKLPMYDWAVGGAATDTKYWIIPGFKQEVQSWQDYMESAKNYQPSNTLFTVLIGANDFVNYGKSVDTVIAEETEGLQHLIAAGARNILLLKLPDVSRAPVYTMGYQRGAAAVAAQVTDYNQRLDALAASLEAQYGRGLHLTVFDTYAMFNQLLSKPERFDMKETVISCLNINSSSAFNYLENHALRPYCADPSHFVFWDNMHPTTQTHWWLAWFVADFVRKQFNLQ